jgi:predicted RNase H-like HicB family nuclease
MPSHRISVGASFPVRLERDPEDGLVYARCLSLQGCHTFGRTREEALEKMREAIVAHLAVSLHAAAPAVTAPQGGPEVVELVA